MERHAVGARPVSWPPPPPGFRLDDDDDRIPSPPRGFSLDKTPSLDNDSLVAAVDGDTAKLASGRNLRLWGVDAPELRQQGWNRQGMPVPIGQQARTALDAMIAGGKARAGQQAMQSYGRPVAPVTVGNNDAGEVMARHGNALAAPEYLDADPQRRYQYMQAERLARLNRLGIHDTMFQNPAEFRRNPISDPSHETIAQFWDTPTPLAGMRPDDEAQYVALLRTARSPDEILSFVEARGMKMDRGDAEKWIANRDDYHRQGRELPAYALYREGPRPLTDLGDGRAGAAVRGFGAGTLAGALDEIGAGADMLGLTPGRENLWNSERRIADIWANNQRQNAAILGYDRSAHPWAAFGGEIAGGLVVPFGARARTVPELFRVGAGYGAAQGFMGTEGNVGERAIGGAVGVPLGGALGAAGGKAIELAARYGPGLSRTARARWRGEVPQVTPSALDDIAGAAPSRTVDYLDVDAGFPPPRSRDVIDINNVPAPPRGFTLDKPSPIDTAYPGPVAGAPRSLDDITPDVQAWASEQGIGADGMMLHGSRTPGITEFDPYQYANYGLYGQGTYLTDNPGVALGYTGKGAKGATEGRTLYSVEQSVRNPLDLDAPADLGRWGRLVEEHGLELQQGMTNADAYRQLEDAIAENMVPKWEGAEIMSDAIRAMGHDGLTHVGGGRYGGGRGPDHRVIIALDPEQTAIRGSLDVGAMMQPPMRDRDWIDIGQRRQRDIIDIGDVPPPPRGFTLDQPQGSRSMGMDAEPMPSISQTPRQRDYLDMGPVRAGRMDQPLSDAQRRALAQDIQPRDVLPIMSNEIGSVEEAFTRDAGRFVEARAPHERTELTRHMVRGWNGTEVPKLGPIDMVGWLRLNGGLVDQGGELAHMGLNNAARKMDFAGQEARFGPLVNDMGMTLDDAANRAWEAGYFPDRTERPSVNDFLDALRDTHEGRQRRFLPEDQPEIERFYGAQSDRYDLEQQRLEVGSPVYADRSVPADEPQPFAPPEAYEEWPAGGPDFAGNINLSKLESPQDITRALTMTEKRVGFDAATRGRVAQAETERLASELNLTPEKLLERRQGQAFNAEEALAARQILAKSGNELVNLARRIQRLDNPGDEEAAAFQQALLRHAAIQEQVSGMTAEAGRALQQFRMTADSRAISREVLASMTAQGGGPRRIVDAAEAILEAVEQSPGKFNTVVRNAAKPRFADKQAELYISMILSRPTTHIVNMAGNTLTSLAQIPEHMVAGAIGKARQMVPGANIDRITGTEVGQRAFGLIQGTKEGAEMFVQALRTGESSDTFSKVQGHEMRAISGLKGEIIRLPLRFLTAEDELFKGIARRMEINGLAARQAYTEGLKGEAAKARVAELSANPTDEMIERALDYSRHLTFQQQLSGTGGDISQMVRHNPWLRPIITFVRTPVNLLKFAAERSPAAPLLKEWRADMQAGGARRDLAIAKSMIGTGLATLFYQMALEGKITGAAPDDPAKRRYWLAEGNQPYSFRIGDTWYNYARLDPFSTTVGVAADLATKADGMSDKQLENYTMLLAGSMIDNLANKVWLSGVTDFVEAMSDTQRYGPGYLRRLAASYTIPNFVNGVAQAIDPVARERDSVADEFRSRIPGLSDSLPPKRDIWGRPISYDYVGPDFLSPFRQSDIQNDPVTQEMIAIGARFGPPSRHYSVDGERHEYTAEQYDRLQEIAGQATHQGIGELISQPGWNGIDDDSKLKAVRKVFDQARKVAKAQVLGLGGDSLPPPPPGFTLDGGAQADADIPPPPPGYTMTDTPPPPAGFTIDGASAEGDVYNDLQAAIPGVRITSGYRDEAYQADMRRRGYRPAQNSAHLDGSALDLLPPPGKSMAWLRDQVRKYDPDARVLDEGDHLHVTFPGYYGAPALGGARAAGLRNPLEAIPPPPPGFVLVP